MEPILHGDEEIEDFSRCLEGCNSRDSVSALERVRLLSDDVVDTRKKFVQLARLECLVMTVFSVASDDEPNCSLFLVKFRLEPRVGEGQLLCFL